MQKALAAALPQNREAALREFRNDIWARSNTRSQDSRWKSWCKICWEWNVSPLPLTPEVIEKVSASLKAGGYKSVRQFFSRARREHIVSTCLQVPPEVELSMKDAVRSLERGLGGPALKEAFRREDIKLAVKSRDECGVAALIALGIWFLLRELEIAALRVRDIVIDIDQKTVSLTLSASKTDTVGNSVVRTHKCYCSFVDKGMCPYHASLKFLPHMPKDPAPPLFSSGAGQPLAKQEVINIIRSVLHENKIPLTKPGVAGAPCRQRFMAIVFESVAPRCFADLGYRSARSCYSGAGVAKLLSDMCKMPSWTTSTSSRDSERPSIWRNASRSSPPKSRRCKSGPR